MKAILFCPALLPDLASFWIFFCLPMQPHVSNNIFAIALPFPAAFLANKFALLHRTQATKTKLTKIKQTNRRPGQQKKKCI